MASSRGHAPYVAGLACLTAAFLCPAVVHPWTRMLAADGDANLFIWAWWHVPRALLHGHDPFRSDGLFFPVGVDLSFHTFAPLSLIWVWPAAKLGGWPLAVNVNQVLAAFASAVVTYLLALRVTGDRRAAFFAGTAFTFLPYRFVHLGGHFNLIHTWIIPLGLLGHLRAAEDGSARRWALAGLLLGAGLLVDAQYVAFLALAVVVLAWRRPGGLGIRLRGAVLYGACALVAASPLLVPMARAARAGELAPVGGWSVAAHYSADLLAWVVPPESHPIWGAAVAPVRAGLAGFAEGLAYPGLTVLVLAVAGRELPSRAKRRGWVALAAVAGILALGPFLQVGGQAGRLFRYQGRSFSIPLPFALATWIPGLNSLRVPGRLCVVASLGLCILGALALADLHRRGGRWRLAWLVATAVVVVEFLPGRLPTRTVAVPTPYRAIAATDDHRAVLELPLQWSLGWGAVGDTAPGREREDSNLVFWATVHGRPLVSGTTSRYPRKRLERLLSIPVFRQVLALEDEPGFDDPARFTAADLCDLGIGFVVYHRDRPVPAAYRYVRRLRLPVLADDGTVVVWHVPDCGRSAKRRPGPGPAQAALTVGRVPTGAGNLAANV